MKDEQERYNVLQPYKYRDANQVERNGWTEVGVAFSGKASISVVIRPGLAVSGKLVLMKPRHNNDDAGGDGKRSRGATAEATKPETQRVTDRPAAFVYEAREVELSELV